MWIAVPQDEFGMWFGDPIGADTEAEIRKLAAEQWSGRLSRGIDVVIFACHQIDVLDLPKDDDDEQPESAETARCAHTQDMFESSAMTEREPE
jgi:hypothetical protein